MSFWQRVGTVTAAVVRAIGGTSNSDWHVASRSAGTGVRKSRPHIEPAADVAPDSAGEAQGKTSSEDTHRSSG